MHKSPGILCYSERAEFLAGYRDIGAGGEGGLEAADEQKNQDGGFRTVPAGRPVCLYSFPLSHVPTWSPFLSR